MYSRRLAGSGMARNFASQSRCAWLERGEYPTRGASSEAKAKEENVRANTSTNAAIRRMQFLSGVGSGGQLYPQSTTGQVRIRAGAPRTVENRRFCSCLTTGSSKPSLPPFGVDGWPAFIL